MNSSELNTIAQRVERHRRRLSWAMTPEERLQRFDLIQSRAMTLLATNPNAMATFVRRNHHARRESRVRQLKAEMMRSEVLRTGDE